jgi:hypothetical protein
MRPFFEDFRTFAAGGTQGLPQRLTRCCCVSAERLDLEALLAVLNAGDRL